MKNLFYSALAVAAVLCGCQANAPLEVNTPSMKKMTLTATIPSSDTKVIYEEEFTDAGLALKACWSGEDAISVVYYNEYGDVLDIVDFTIESGYGSSVGTFVGYSDCAVGAVACVAVYPKINTDSFNDFETIEVEESQGLTFYRDDFLSAYGPEPSEMERLAKAVPYMGMVKSAEGSLETVLNPVFSLLKVSIQIPEEYRELVKGEDVTLAHLDDDMMPASLFSVASYYVVEEEWEYESTSVPLNLHFETDCAHAVNEYGEFEAYYMLLPQNFKAGHTLRVNLGSTPTGNLYAERTLSSDTFLSAGKLYTLTGPAQFD